MKKFCVCCSKKLKALRKTRTRYLQTGEQHLYIDWPERLVHVQCGLAWSLMGKPIIYDRDTGLRV